MLRLPFLPTPLPPWIVLPFPDPSINPQSGPGPLFLSVQQNMRTFIQQQSTPCPSQGLSALTAGRRNVV